MLLYDTALSINIRPRRRDLRSSTILNMADKVQSELKNCVRDDALSGSFVKDSLQYAEDHVDEDLHPAFDDCGISYDSENDCFCAVSEGVYDDTALFDSQQAFANALEQYQKGANQKYESQIDLATAHTWSEVMEQADKARKEYTGVDKEGIMKKINAGLRTFQTAAPAIEAWLKLLPSTTIYGSIVCGGFTIILEVCRPPLGFRKLKLIECRQQSISKSFGRRPWMPSTRCLFASRKRNSLCERTAMRKSTSKLAIFTWPS